jgi:4-carboxymuconolactone decarboxylase
MTNNEITDDITRSRLEPIPVTLLSPEQRELYDVITTGPRAQGPQHFNLTDKDGSLLGPFNALLLSPALGTALQEVGASIRYRTALTAREREIAVLIVAAYWDSKFEISAHENIGRAIGLMETEIGLIRIGGIPELSDPRELACAHLVRAMVQGDVDDQTWTTWTPAVDNVTVFELSSLVGYYAGLALQMRIFRVG